ncbi:hypothetical protein ABIC52_001837 [Curtobacterium oceanosedimentum]
MSLRLYRPWLPHVQVGVGAAEGELTVRITGHRVAEDETEPDGLEPREPGAFIEELRHEQVGVDDRLGDRPGHGCGADVRNGVVGSERVGDEVSNPLEGIRPRRVVGLQGAGVDLSERDALQLTSGVAA